MWIDFFIQVPRHVPHFKNLIKTSYYYSVSKSLKTLYSTQSEHPGCLPQVISPDARVPTDGYWDPKSNKSKKSRLKKLKNSPRDQKFRQIRGSRDSVYTLFFAPAVFLQLTTTNIIFLCFNQRQTRWQERQCSHSVRQQDHV